MGSLEIRPYLRSLSLEFQELSTRRRSESPHRSCLGNCQQLDQFISKDVNLPELSRTVCFWRRLGVVTPSNDAFRFKAIMRSPERTIEKEKVSQGTRKFEHGCRTNNFIFAGKAVTVNTEEVFPLPGFLASNPTSDPPQLVSHTSGSFIARFGRRILRSFTGLTVIMSDYGHDDDVEET